MTLTVPSLRAEQRSWDAGAEVVVGIDEVGRGAWAGPVTVGAVVVPRSPRLYKVRDSKMLTRAQRESLCARILAWAPAVGVGHASHSECDALGMTAALALAASRALGELGRQGAEPDRILLDGKHDYLGDSDRVETIVKGDASSLGIAAASVVAKVTRDRLMVAEAEHFPAYGFESNVGYPAPVHQCALAAFGPTSIHRRSWIYMENLPWFQTGPAQPSLF
ncbi:MAG: ribonuclease HII [Actinobacteria bacterium]|nr:ribonuclease HII [Actinomycetota bacterium]